MIWVQNQLVGVREGQKLTLECFSEAFPKSINYWTRDQDKIVAQGGKYEPVLKDNAYKVHMILTINSVSPADYGSYKCVSRNSLGDTDGSIKVYRKCNYSISHLKFLPFFYAAERERERERDSGNEFHNKRCLAKLNCNKVTLFSVYTSETLGRIGFDKIAVK
ncbi:hypothetical protein ACFW04_002146 [Cataglyphis niger]